MNGILVILPTVRACRVSHTTSLQTLCELHQLSTEVVPVIGNLGPDLLSRQAGLLVSMGRLYMLWSHLSRERSDIEARNAPRDDLLRDGPLRFNRHADLATARPFAARRFRLGFLAAPDGCTRFRLHVDAVVIDPHVRPAAGRALVGLWRFVGS